MKDCDLRNKEGLRYKRINWPQRRGERKNTSPATSFSKQQGCRQVSAAKRSHGGGEGTELLGAVPGEVGKEKKEPQGRGSLRELRKEREKKLTTRG